MSDERPARAPRPIPPAPPACGDVRARGFWVFGYGSLMWRPGFAPADARPALLKGYHRALCIHSIRYRGTWERPGLVVGLDRGGSCRGRALRVRGEDADRVLAALWEREMPTDSYIPKWLPVVLAPRADAPGARRETAVALAFVVNRDNPTQYAGRMDTDEIARRVLAGHGIMGSALDYLENVIRHLDDMGIREGALHATLDRATALQREAGDGAAALAATTRPPGHEALGENAAPGGLKKGI